MADDEDPRRPAEEQRDGGWVRRSSRYLFESRWYNLRQDEVVLPNGEPITYTLVEHPGYALVVPLLDDGRVVLERVYRYTVQETVLECPSGGLDGDPPEAAARRELEEETGWIAGRLEPLGSFFGSNGISDERFWLFLATGLRQGDGPRREATEQIELEPMPLDRAVELAPAGGIRDAPSALALMLAHHRLRQRG
jgi:ADP-ribose pyrophosphatase